MIVDINRHRSFNRNAFMIFLPILSLLILCHPPRLAESQTVSKTTHDHNMDQEIPKSIIKKIHELAPEMETTTVTKETITKDHTTATPIGTTYPLKMDQKEPVQTVEIVMKNKEHTPFIKEESVEPTDHNNVKPIRIARLNFTEDIFFTLVYGSEHAKMNVTNAEKFCIKIGAKLNLRAPVTAESHLVSIHDPFIMKTLMDWILTKERRQFRIGGDVTKVMHHDRIYFVVRWYDGSRDDFRFFSDADQSFASLAPGETVNLAVGYLDGRWIPMLPQRKAYFLCETRINDPDAMLRDSPNIFQHFAHRGNREGHRRH